VLGALYISMIQPIYQPHQIFYIVAMSGVIMFLFWRPIHSLGSIFHCLPGKIHASMVFGIVLIVFSRVKCI
jgi:predicted PurR-regulated permease PerM